MKWALSSFFSLCTEEIFSISSNLIMQFFFLPSAVKVAFTSAVPFRLTYQSNVVSDVGVIRYTNWLTTSWLIVLPLKSIKLFRVERIPSISNPFGLLFSCGISSSAFWSFLISSSTGLLIAWYSSLEISPSALIAIKLVSLLFALSNFACIVTVSDWVSLDFSSL